MRYMENVKNVLSRYMRVDFKSVSNGAVDYLNNFEVAGRKSLDYHKHGKGVFTCQCWEIEKIFRLMI